MISVTGISHHTAPVEVRERFAVGTGALPAVLEELRGRYGAAVLLSTCNRTELYLSRPAGLAEPEELREALNALSGAGPADPECIYIYGGREAARHLLRVTAGLDSMVLGEDQILGQVRTAFMVAAGLGTTDRLLSRLFHLAIATGRRVRSQTCVGRYARSVSAAAVEAVRARVGSLDGVTVLVLGAGEAGKLTVRNLAAAGAGRLLLYNRTYERAQRLAATLGGVPVDAAGLPAALAETDVVISASAAMGYQLTSAMLRDARAGGAGRPLLVVDIAVPRDVDPVVAAEPGVTLLDIDGLRSAAVDGDAGLADVTAAETIVDEEVGRLAAWWDTLRVVPTISALREQAEEIRRAELARTFGRMRDLTSADRGRLEALTAAIVNKLLHHPIAKLKEPGAGERYAAVVHELFDLPRAVSE